MTSDKRKKTEEFILKYIKKITDDERNVNLYRNMFKRMSMKEFTDWMIDLRDKKICLQIIAPNGDNKVKVSIENNFAIAKELNFDFFDYVSIPAKGDMPAYVTPQKLMLLILPFRRMSQTLDKKISTSSNTSSIDIMTGQVTGDSRSSKMTLPETQLLLAAGLNKTLTEFLTVRGGDLGASNAFIGMLSKTGEANLEEISKYATGVVSGKTLKAFYRAMHIQSTL